MEVQLAVTHHSKEGDSSQWPGLQQRVIRTPSLERRVYPGQGDGETRQLSLLVAGRPALKSMNRQFPKMYDTWIFVPNCMMHGYFVAVKANICVLGGKYFSWSSWGASLCLASPPIGYHQTIPKIYHTKKVIKNIQVLGTSIIDLLDHSDFPGGLHDDWSQHK